MAQFLTVHTISQCSHMQTAQKNAELRDKRQTQGLLELLIFFYLNPEYYFLFFYGAVLNRAQFLRVLHKSRRVVLPLLPYNERVRSRRAMRR